MTQFIKNQIQEHYKKIIFGFSLILISILILLFIITKDISADINTTDEINSPTDTNQLQELAKSSLNNSILPKSLNSSVEYNGPVSYEYTTVGSFEINNAKAFCMDHDLPTPPNTTSVSGTLYTSGTSGYSKKIAAALYYGLGGPECIVSDTEAGHVGTAMACDYAMNGENSISRPWLPKEYWDIRKYIDAEDVPAGASYIIWNTGNSNMQRLGQAAPVQVQIELLKKSEDSHTPLPGAVYVLYSDKACTKKIFELPPTDQGGTAVSPAFSKEQETYYLKELIPPHGYILSAQVYPVDVKNGQTITVTALDKEQLYHIHGSKADSQSKSTVPQGDATLAGARYGLFAAEDIYHIKDPDNPLYSINEKIMEAATNEEGMFSFNYISQGKYYIKELSPSSGYLLDESIYHIDCSSEDNTLPEIIKELTVFETVKKQAFELIKISSDGESGPAELLHAGFSIYLISDLKGVKDHSLLPSNGEFYSGDDFLNYDFSGDSIAREYSDDKSGIPIPEIFTDEKGYLISPRLPYGTYVIIESTVPDGYLPVQPFIVEIYEDSFAPLPWRILNDKAAQFYLKIEKRDSDSGELILKPGAKYRIFDCIKNTYIEQITTTPTPAKLGTIENPFQTSEKGYLVTPQPIGYGTFRIEEVNAPSGYILHGYDDNTAPIILTIDDTTPAEIDPVTGQIITATVRQYNKPQTGILKLMKKGETLLNVSGDEQNGYSFIYEDSVIEGAHFEIRARKDIYTPDNQNILLYEADTLIETLITDEAGEAISSSLPLGAYYIQEVKAGTGFVLDSQDKDFILSPQEDTISIIYEDIEFYNQRQKISLNIQKQDSENHKPLGGAEFRLYSLVDIFSASGNLLLEKDTYICSAQSDENGVAAFPADLPFGSYYAIEHQAPEGYLSYDDDIIFEINYDTSKQDLISIELTHELENTAAKIEIMKTDKETGLPLAGATLELCGENGEVIDTWKTTDKSHVVKALPLGTYTLKETNAPDGYYLSDDILFSAEVKEEKQKIIMENDYYGYVEILKTEKNKHSNTNSTDYSNRLSNYSNKSSNSDYSSDSSGHLNKTVLAGAVFELYQKSNNTLLATLTTDQNGIVQSDELPRGSYYLIEKTPPKGYLQDDTIHSFEITSPNQIIQKEIENSPVSTEAPKAVDATEPAQRTPTPKTEDSSPLLFYLPIAIFFGLLSYFLIIRKYHDKISKTTHSKHKDNTSK